MDRFSIGEEVRESKRRKYIRAARALLTQQRSTEGRVGGLNKSVIVGFGDNQKRGKKSK